MIHKQDGNRPVLLHTALCRTIVLRFEFDSALEAADKIETNSCGSVYILLAKRFGIRGMVAGIVHTFGAHK